MLIRDYHPRDRAPLLALWRTVFPDDGPHNEAGLVLDAKLKVDALIVVAVDRDALVGAMMAGYDGHRGWLYSVAVAPRARRRGIGAGMVHHALQRLRALGCTKVNLQVRSGNASAVAFYASLGFTVEERISMGRLLERPAQR